MIWNDKYERYNKLWGDNPSELALAAVFYLWKEAIDIAHFHVLDVACGYGRDAFYLHRKLGCRVTGIDISSKAIDMANASLSNTHNGFLQFTQHDFLEFRSPEFDMLFVSKLYHLLDQQERNRFLQKVMENLKPNGLLFLSTLSVRDPQVYGKGVPHPSEPDAFYYEKVYRRFSTAGSMQRDFRFLKIEKLFEHEYLEPREDGEPHHHILWILIGKRLE